MTKKLFYLFGLLLMANFTFVACNRDDFESDPTTEIGVVIDGIRWATRNVNTPGTFAPHPHSAGRLFQWGTLNGVTHHFDNTTASHINGWHGTDTASERIAWTSVNDPCPTGWRVPTIEELTALRNAGYSDWTELGGVNGRFFGAGQNRIFLPAAGWRNASSGWLNNVDGSISYWSNSQLDGWNAEYLHFSRLDYVFTPFRSLGFSIRCVAID